MIEICGQLYHPYTDIIHYSNIILRTNNAVSNFATSMDWKDHLKMEMQQVLTSPHF